MSLPGEEYIRHFAFAVGMVAEAVAVVMVAVAVVVAAVNTVRFLVAQDDSHPWADVRLDLGRWLAVALEFLLAADIVRTAVAPTWEDIGKLAAIAVIRTALNYFLRLDIREEAEKADREQKA